MREILFKGKKKDNGEWIEGYLLDGGMPGEKRIFIGKLVIGKWTIMADEFDEVDPDTICEYTGLTDKNGKKIWENDIVLVTNKNYCSGKIESSIGNIFFTFGTWYIGGKTQDRLYSINNDTIFQIEVVGNIFDNPELFHCAGCRCNHCANNVETGDNCAGEAIKACFVCDECNWYDGNLKNRDMTCRQCEDYIVTNQHAEYLRKRIKVIKR